MALYKLLQYGVQHTVSGKQIPPIVGNSDWSDYLAWVDAGNTPDPADVAPVLTVAQFIDQLNNNGNDAVAMFIRGLVIVLANRFSLTPAQVLTAIKNAAT